MYMIEEQIKIKASAETLSSETNTKEKASQTFTELLMNNNFLTLRSSRQVPGS